MQRRNNKRPYFTYILKIVLNQVVIEKSAVIVSTGVVLSKRIIANTKNFLSSLLSNMICSDGCKLIHWSIPKFATKSLFLTSKQVNAWGIYWRKVRKELVKGKGLVPLWFRFGPALVPVWSRFGPGLVRYTLKQWKIKLRFLERRTALWLLYVDTSGISMSMVYFIVQLPHTRTNSSLLGIVFLMLMRRQPLNYICTF